MRTLRRRVLAKRSESASAGAARPQRRGGGAATAVLDRPGDAPGEETDVDAGEVGQAGGSSARGRAGTPARGATAAGRRGTGPRNQPRRGGSRSKRR